MKYRSRRRCASSARHDHFEELRKIAFKVIPKYYEVVNSVAKKRSLPLTDRLGPATCRNLRLVMKEMLDNHEYESLLSSWGIEKEYLGF